MSDILPGLDNEGRRYETLQILDGIYEGYVEHVSDPYKLGRIKVRIPELHHPNKDVFPTSALPWARPANFNGGGCSDSGSFIVPTLGSFVFVAFIKGNQANPVYLGTSNKKYVEGQTYGVKDGLPSLEPSMGEWAGSEGLSTAREAHQPLNNDPTTKVIYKSPKGAIIYVEEEDENEHVRIIDRGGQSISLVSRISSGNNQGNAFARGLATAINDDHALTADTHEAHCWIEVMDQSRQLIRMDALDQEEKIYVRNNRSQSDLYNSVMLDATDGKEHITFTDHTRQQIRINSESGDSRVSLTLPSGLSIVLENDNEDVHVNIPGSLLVNIVGNLETKIDGDSILEIGGNLEKFLSGDEISSIQGNCDLDIAGNHSIATGGDSNLDVGGDHLEASGGSRSATVGGDKAEDISGSYGLTVNADYNSQVLGSYGKTVLGDELKNIFGSRGATVFGDDLKNVFGDKGETILGNYLAQTFQKYSMITTGDYVVESTGLASILGTTGLNLETTGLAFLTGILVGLNSGVLPGISEIPVAPAAPGQPVSPTAPGSPGTPSTPTEPRIEPLFEPEEATWTDTQIEKEYEQDTTPGVRIPEDG